MEKQQTNNPGQKPYIRHSEIPEQHKHFTKDAEPFVPEGEQENCYPRQAYEKWLERWETEGGLTGDLPE